MQARRSNSDRSQETREALIAAARVLFCEKGFGGTGTPELAERAGLTRGALYHHYKDKLAVFQAVVEAEAAEVAREIEENTVEAETPVQALLQGAKAYFRAMQQAGRLRLLLVEGPAVLGLEAMRRIDLETGGLELRRGLEAAFGDTVPPETIAIYADLVSAMFDRAALAIGASGAAQAYEKAIEGVLVSLVNQGPDDPTGRD